MNIITQYCSTDAVTWTAVFCRQSSTCLQARLRKGQALLCCNFSFQVHNLPSCPVLKNFQQTVERRSVESLLFLLEDGSRWLPVSSLRGCLRLTQGGWATPAYFGRWKSFLICCIPPPEATAPSWGLYLSHCSVKSSASSQEHELGKSVSMLRRLRRGLTSCLADSCWE